MSSEPERHALITGGSSGIGLALAQRFVARGTSVSLIARGLERLNAAQQTLLRQADAKPDSQRPRVEVFAADVGDRHAVQTACRDAAKALGSPQTVVLNAGIAHPGHFLEIDNEIFEQTMQTNYFGVLWPARCLAPLMAEAGGGRMAFVSSGAALVGMFGYTAYAPSKFAVRGLAEALRAELAYKGITVSIVYPPDTDTPQLAEETKTKPAETKAITASGGVLSADAVAASILNGLDRGRFEIAPGGTMALLNRFHSVLNPLVRAHFDRLTRRAQESTRD